jgi:hypothetical protein
MIDSDRLIDQAQDVYCHDIARIDVLGPVRRLIFTVPATDSTGYHHVSVKLILPAELMLTLGWMALGTKRPPDGAYAPELLSLDTGRAARHVPTVASR